MMIIRTTFKKILEKHPIIVNSLIYGTLCVSAETMQQLVSNKVIVNMNNPSKSLDMDVIQRYTIYGFGLAGPIVSFWYRYLDYKLPGTVPTIVVKKLLIDQFLFTPQLLVLFYISMSIMEKKENIFEECKNKFGNTFKTSCMFWIPAQGINFAFVPSIYRVSYVGLCSFIWVNILCYLKRQEIK